MEFEDAFVSLDGLRHYHRQRLEKFVVEDQGLIFHFGYSEAKIGWIDLFEMVSLLF